jgi:hypothetical protein
MRGQQQTVCKTGLQKRAVGQIGFISVQPAGLLADRVATCPATRQIFRPNHHKSGCGGELDQSLKDPAVS